MVSDRDRMWTRGKQIEEEEVKNNKINVYTDGHALKYKINAEVLIMATVCDSARFIATISFQKSVSIPIYYLYMFCTLISISYV